MRCGTKRTKRTCSVEKDLAGCWVIETGDQLLYGGLPASTRAPNHLSTGQVGSGSKAYTRATLVPPLMVMLTPFSTSTSFREGYLNRTSRNSIGPFRESASFWPTPRGIAD